jgi:hypothetical protein
MLRGNVDFLEDAQFSMFPASNSALLFPVLLSCRMQ